MLELKNICYTVSTPETGEQTILKDISVTIPDGKLIVVTVPGVSVMEFASSTFAIGLSALNTKLITFGSILSSGRTVALTTSIFASTSSFRSHRL